MAEKGNWQSQNMKKSGVVAGPSSMNSKITGNSFHCGNPKVSKPTVRNYADGGMVESEASDKAAGLKASSGESVGFFERLRMGNIDQPGSEAYNRLGAGRAQLDRMDAEAEEVRAANRTPTPAKAADTPDLGAFNEAGSGVVNDTKPDAPAPAKAAAKPTPRKVVSAAKSSRSEIPPVKSVMTDNSFDDVENARLSRSAKPSTANASDRTAETAKRTGVDLTGFRRGSSDPRITGPKRDYRRVTPVDVEDDGAPAAIVGLTKSIGSALTSSGSDSASRYLKAKISRGESLTPSEAARAKSLGIKN